MNNSNITLGNVFAEQQKLIPPEQGGGFKVKDELQSARVDLDAELCAPEVVLFVLNTDGAKVPICSLGNIATVIGKAKAKKTFFNSMLIASFLSEWPVGKLQSGARENKDQAILIDSEQSAYHTQKVAKRIAFLANLKDQEKLHVYGLRRYTYVERVKLIEEALITHPCAGLMVIDGVRDLLADINDASEASLLVGRLMKWSEIYNIHILCVLHQNKGDNNARGHLGTEIVNKSETVLSVTRDDKNKSVSIVDPEYCRDREPDQIVFHINDEGLPEMIDEIPGRTESNSSPTIKYPNMLDQLVHIEILSITFSQLQDKPSRSRLIEGLKLTLNEKGIKNSNSDLNTLVGWYLRNGYIKQEGTPKTRHSWFART